MEWDGSDQAAYEQFDRFRRALQIAGWWGEFSERTEELMYLHGLTPLEASRISVPEFNRKLNAKTAVKRMADEWKASHHLADQGLAAAGWVKSNLGNMAVNVDDAPNCGAWVFLLFSRDDPTILNDLMDLLSRITAENFLTPEIDGPYAIIRAALVHKMYRGRLSKAGG